MIFTNKTIICKKVKISDKSVSFGEKILNITKSFLLRFVF